MFLALFLVLPYLLFLIVFIRSKRLRKITFWTTIAYTVCFLIAAGPILGTAIASVVADAHGCTLNEGSAHHCMIDGVDYGDMLYGFFVMGWLTLVTLPLGGFLAFGVVFTYCLYGFISAAGASSVTKPAAQTDGRKT